MATNIKETAVLNRLVNELKEIKLHLRQLLLLMPEESLDEYSNSKEIKKAHRKALKSFPPK